MTASAMYRREDSWHSPASRARVANQPPFDTAKFAWRREWTPGLSKTEPLNQSAVDKSPHHHQPLMSRKSVILEGRLIRVSPPVRGLTQRQQRGASKYRLAFAHATGTSPSGPKTALNRPERGANTLRFRMVTAMRLN